MKAALTGLVCALAWPVAVAAAPSPCQAPLPLQSKEPALQIRLESELDRLGLDDAVKSGRLAVSVVDLSDPTSSYYAGVNDDVMLYAASLPKIAILLAVIELANEGHIEWTPEFDYRLRKMITISNNAYASWGADMAGLAGIAEVLQRPQYCFYQRPHGGLWLGRPYRKSAQSNRDPLFNISHGATSRQTARWYAMLDEQLLVSPYWSERMRDMMAPPEYFHKFVGAIGSKPGVQFVARKSGTWRAFHADSALIQHHAQRYIIVALAEMGDGERALRLIGSAVDEIIMQGAHRRY